MSLKDLPIQTANPSHIVKQYYRQYGIDFGIHQETAFPNIKVRQTRRYNSYTPPWERSDVALGYVRGNQPTANLLHTELRPRRLIQMLQEN